MRKKITNELSRDKFSDFNIKISYQTLVYSLKGTSIFYLEAKSPPKHQSHWNLDEYLQILHKLRMQFEISFKTIYKEISPHFNSLLFVKGYFNTLTLTKPMARRDHLIFTVMLNFKGPTLQLVYHIKIGRQISTAIYTKFKSSDSNLTPCNLNSPNLRPLSSLVSFTAESQT